MIWQNAKIVIMVLAQQIIETARKTPFIIPHNIEIPLLNNPRFLHI
jgi:hypothetical protein